RGRRRAGVGDRTGPGRSGGGAARRTWLPHRGPRGPRRTPAGGHRAPVTDAERFGRCIGGGGLVVFPSDTVYGLACDPENRASVERLYRLKGRSAAKPSAVMFFDLDAALGGLPELGSRTEQAMRQLLPGGVTLLVANPGRRFELACGDDPETLGVRVPDAP